MNHYPTALVVVLAHETKGDRNDGGEVRQGGVPVLPGTPAKAAAVVAMAATSSTPASCASARSPRTATSSCTSALEGLGLPGVIFAWPVGRSIDLCVSYILWLTRLQGRRGVLQAGPEGDGRRAQGRQAPPPLPPAHRVPASAGRRDCAGGDDATAADRRGTVRRAQLASHGHSSASYLSRFCSDERVHNRLFST